MSTANTITTIDIGSSKIRTVIGYFDSENKDNFHILGVGLSNSNAIRKGNILDMEEFKNNLDASLAEAEKMAGEQVNGAYISFNSSSFEIYRNKGVVAVTGGEISEDDIDRALEMAKNGVDLPNKEILKVIPEHFSVDLEEGIKNPIGMSARKLEVVSNIFSMNLNVLNNIRKAISDIGIEIYDIYPNLLSSPEGVLSKRQKELGVVCIDIGASTTGLTLYENGVLNYSSIIPIGGDNVTNDIALGLRTSTVVAEKIKIDYAELNLERDENYVDHEFDLRELNMGEEGLVSRVYLSRIVTARYEEILYFVREELKKVGRDGMLPEGAVCVGGGVKMRGFVNLSKKNLKLPVFIGTPVSKDELVDSSISDPVFAAVIGTMILSNLYGTNSNLFTFNISGFIESLKKMFKKLLPK
ncbi:MAG: cell division protein FtsA [Candidatus Gracilibacteria bacterium]|nr:cell division protein FtsA [Candidatus Gracilibacteria bacterium]